MILYPYEHSHQLSLRHLAVGGTKSCSLGEVNFSTNRMWKFLWKQNPTPGKQKNNCSLHIHHTEKKGAGEGVLEASHSSLSSELWSNKNDGPVESDDKQQVRKHVAI